MKLSTKTLLTIGFKKTTIHNINCLKKNNVILIKNNRKLGFYIGYIIPNSLHISGFYTIHSLNQLKTLTNKKFSLRIK